MPMRLIPLIVLESHGTTNRFEARGKRCARIETLEHAAARGARRVAAPPRRTRALAETGH